MPRALIVCCVAALAAGTAGCRMCAHPYDYCGPTFTGQCGEPCLPNARAGSILEGCGPMVTGCQTGCEMGTELSTEPTMEAEPGRIMPVPDDTTKTSPATRRQPRQQTGQAGPLLSQRAAPRATNGMWYR